MRPAGSCEADEAGVGRKPAIGEAETIIEAIGGRARRLPPVSAEVLSAILGEGKSVDVRFPRGDGMREPLGVSEESSEANKDRG